MTDNRYEYTGHQQHLTLSGKARQTPWEIGSDHRVQVLRLLQLGDTDGRRGMICVFGVGDGTALDLNRLLARFHEVHLVDPDASQMDEAIQAQNVKDSHRIRRWSNVDITGIDQWLFGNGEPTDEIPDEELVERARQHAIPELGQFEMVLSSCLLWQLTSRVVEHFSKASDSPDPSGSLGEALLAVRNRHLELLVEHTTAGGSALLVNDFVSSDTLPELTGVPGELGGLVEQAIAGGNFFPGTSPAAIDHWLYQNEWMRERLQGVDLSRPWIHRQPNRCFACMAFRLRVGSSPDP